MFRFKDLMLGFRVFRVWGLGLRVWVWVWGLGFGAEGFKVEGLGFRI